METYRDPKWMVSISDPFQSKMAASCYLDYVKNNHSYSTTEKRESLFVKVVVSKTVIDYLGGRVLC